MEGQEKKPECPRKLVAFMAFMLGSMYHRALSAPDGQREEWQEKYEHAAAAARFMVSSMDKFVVEPMGDKEFNDGFMLMTRDAGAFGGGTHNDAAMREAANCVDYWSHYEQKHWPDGL